MKYTIVYSEQELGKSIKRYKIPNLTIDKVKKIISILIVPIPRTLVKFVVYDENNQIYAVGDNRVEEC